MISPSLDFFIHKIRIPSPPGSRTNAETRRLHADPAGDVPLHTKLLRHQECADVREWASGVGEMPEATSLSDGFEHHRSGSSVLC